MKNNIANKSAGITWVQYLVSLVFITQGVFWVTSIYKDLQHDIEKTERLKLEILDAREQSKRRIINAEERIMLKKDIKHLELELKIARKEIEYLKE